MNNNARLRLSAGLVVLSTAFPSVHAQTNISVYGVADAGLVLERGTPTGNATNISSGVSAGNRLGIKGKEDLGNGNSAIFLLENGYNIDTGTAGQGGLLFGRQAYVGLSGAAGTLTAGRQYSPYYKVMRDVADPFGIGYAGNSLNIMAGNTRVNNMVEYQSPRVGDWSADIGYGAGEIAGDSSLGRTISTALAYTHGIVSLYAAEHRREQTTMKDHTSNSLFVAKVNLDTVAVSVAHAQNLGFGGARSHDSLLGVTVPFGRHKLLGSVIVHHDRVPVSGTAQQYGIAYVYSLSKRTELYAAYAHINNHSATKFTVGNGTDVGSGNTATNLGIRHNF